MLLAGYDVGKFCRLMADERIPSTPTVNVQLGTMASSSPSKKKISSPFHHLHYHNPRLPPSSTTGAWRTLMCRYMPRFDQPYQWEDLARWTLPLSPLAISGLGQSARRVATRWEVSRPMQKESCKRDERRPRPHPDEMDGSGRSTCCMAKKSQGVATSGPGIP